MEKIKAQFLSVKRTSEMLGVSVNSVYRLLKNTDFPKAVKAGRSTKFYTEEVEKWIKERGEKSSRELTPPACARKPGQVQISPESSRHDLFAAAALTGLLSANDSAPKAWIGKEAEVARVAHAIAEAMVLVVKVGAGDTASA